MRAEGYTFGEMVETFYRMRPYLANCSPSDLVARAEEVFSNFYDVTPDGKVGALDLDNGGELWMVKLSDLRMEYARREMSILEVPELRSVFSNLPFSGSTLEMVERNVHLVPLAKRVGHICKFGRQQWLEQLLDGKLRLHPASHYKDQKHNRARRDDELLLNIHVDPYSHDLGLLSSKLRDLLPIREWGWIELRKPTDHYLFCVTVRYNPRLFFDFKESDFAHAEACLVVNDTTAFENRLLAGVSGALPDWNVSFGPVAYYDAFCVNREFTSGRALYFLKSMRFMYQRECRLVALPPQATTTLDPLDVDIGSIRDIAELFHFSS